MTDVTILHNPRCSTSRAALEAVTEAGAQDVEVIDYLKTPLDEAALRALLAKLEDAPTDLVRRDAAFAAAGLTEDDVQTADQVVAVLVAHPQLMQRPVLVRPDRAIIGRPKNRVPGFLAGSS
ncbi:MAG: ArsC/Spx/MgsR family protein [Micrococcales bacterium]|nr:ArsC/Spx/MgsR family protein [Micrococcales bacterium]